MSDDRDNESDKDTDTTCPHCVNGTIRGGYNYPAHRCEDCGGSGYINEDNDDDSN
jgi:uncharacterized protein (DUF983 family)